MYFLVPRLSGRKLWSKKLMDVSWWLTLLGFIIFMAGMMLAGLVANASWFTHQTIVQALPTLTPYFIVRAIGGGIVVVSAFIFAIDIILTIISKPLSSLEKTETIGGVRKD
jgi:cbb3-type cytochrome oxidase subunit 1